MMWVHGATTPWLTAAAETASYLGGQFVLAASVVIALLLCFLRRFGSDSGPARFGGSGPRPGRAV